MYEMPRPDEIPLTLAAQRMRVSYHRARTMMLEGEIGGRQLNGRWYVQSSDVERVAREHANAVAQPA